MPSLTPKFLRKLYVNQDVNQTQALIYYMKVMYEFWGFCRNTPGSLTVPTGFPTNGVNFPAGFESGSLIMSGSSAYTNLGDSYFYDDSADFSIDSNSIKGKHLVAWVSGSESTDDSIYQIKKVFNSGTLLVDTSTGGTPYSSSLRPLFTTRTNVNYRIVDIAETATTIAKLSGSGLVMSLPAASVINDLQESPQFRIGFTADAGDEVEFSISPSGSWNGTDFGSNGKIINSLDYFDVSSAQRGYITLISADDFMFSNIHGSWFTNVAKSSGFHIEIPQRLYTQEEDPNPIVVTFYGNQTLETSKTSISFGHLGYRMFNHITDTVDVWQPQCLSPTGPVFHGTFFNNTGQLSGLRPGKWSGVGHDQHTDEFFVTDIILSYILDPSFFAAHRVRIRRLKLTSDLMPNYSRLGLNGEWIKLNNGILVPWDGSSLFEKLLT